VLTDSTQDRQQQSRNSMLKAAAGLAALAIVSTANIAHAQTTDAPPPAAAAAKPKPPPYSLPWQLRPALAVTVLRFDNALAFYDPPGGQEDSGTTFVSTLAGAYKVLPELSVMVRAGVAHDAPPGDAAMADSATAFLNPVVGAWYMIAPTPALRITPFLGVALPLGSGGGDKPDPDVARTMQRGALARSAMDNAMFAPNYLTPFPGIAVTLLSHGFTVQAEATLLQLMRVRGSNHPQDSKDSSRTNFTTGLHVGYFIIPQLSVGAEIRYQRFLKNDALEAAPDGDVRKDNLTAAIGPRFHIKLGDKIWTRPGIAYSTGFDDPMDANQYRIVQLDVPVLF
jgi:hypothetical protein